MRQDVAVYLDHHGVKGMKWGVRGKRSGSVSRKTDRTVFEKQPKHLTSSELERRIKRMEIEKKYNELNRRDVNKGQQLAAEILTGSGRTVAGTVLTGAALFGIKVALNKKFGPEAAGMITKRK